MRSIERTHFHSIYNPLKEAERFVENSLKGKKPGIIVVIGPGENYIKQVLDVQYPYPRIYYLQPCADFDTAENASLNYWSPNSKISLKDFFHQLLFDEFAVAGIAVLEWEPVTRAFPEISRQIRNEMTRILATTASDRATIAYWSKKWFINSARFYKNSDKFLKLKTMDTPITIIGAGPGLMEYKEIIYQMRKSCFIIAIASALPFLAENKIEPNIVLLSDPGFWNIYHTRELLRSTIPIAMPPSARICQQLYSKPIIVLDTKLVFEQLVIEALSCPSFNVKTFGTSVGTAIDLALKLTSGQINIFGFDLASCDLSTHCSPYSFSTFPLHHSSRIQPFYSSVYSDVIDQYPEKFGQWRFSRSFSTYAEELRVSKDDTVRIRRYSSSPVTVQNSMLAEITYLSGNSDLVDTAAMSPNMYFEEVPLLSKPSFSEKALNYLKQVLEKIKQHNTASLSFNEIVFLKAFCAKELNAILALSVRRELTHSMTDSFVNECMDQAERIIMQYC